MLTAVAMLAGLVAFDLLGYLVHRSLHSPALGRAHRAHKAHHDELYPPSDFLSVGHYRRAGARSTALLFLPPMAVMAAALFWLLPAGLAAGLSAEMVVIGLANDWVHDRLHVAFHWSERVPGMARLRALHFAHHRDQGRNFGIFSFCWDRAFGTLRDV